MNITQCRSSGLIEIPIHCMIAALVHTWCIDIDNLAIHPALDTDNAVPRGLWFG